ncbi:TPA: type VI secretion system lipoprotein TssJ [Klebsiella aerogenes]|uniref:Type VI secretion system lipoprotein TssJ n=1 Tax=Klebsiella aerogenes TaxID=548 RepID=A0AAP9U879_KLEAE|nr:type VI secretion system lipoprotein TssJ [Klebsiella aerogenes]EIV2083793.1 type VI secretion system lipoprotein TssJ [Klebsiella aerogenes]EIW9212034.1 type VI secretion system lipoprotein TssJ [Klebsiella aerogenes]EKM7807884.1 type VI secretion system lipoprotein TssJ [Klebsiella aerogenes]EKU4511820.1 type VI secretion system lipoprotein TssJ [Klebsiella aerogenes]EKU7554002.1 type VI secretion system lipoprotein TssJ [Klebsiella aerogenes]
MNNNSLLRQVMLAFYLFLFTLVSGCGSSSHSDPARYNLQFQAHPQINSSAPLKVRVLVLKSDAEFMSADFYSLQNNAQKVLAGNLLNSDEFFLMPGQLAKKLSGQSSPEARYIGVMAEYQSLDGKKWRISLPLPTSGETPFWQFWKLSADQLQANLYLDVNGIRVVQQ